MSEAWIRALTFAPIVACSIVGMAITIGKWLELRRPALPRGARLTALRELVAGGELAQADREAEADETPGARLLVAALRCAGRPREAMQERVARAGAGLAAEVEYGLGGLSLLAALGPLLGLLGTVVGIVMVFRRLAASGGVASPAELAGGIGTALYTTIAGLGVGILALVIHRILAARADRRIAELEDFALSVVDLVDGSRE